MPKKNSWKSYYAITIGIILQNQPKIMNPSPWGIMAGQSEQEKPMVETSMVSIFNHAIRGFAIWLSVCVLRKMSFYQLVSVWALISMLLLLTTPSSLLHITVHNFEQTYLIYIPQTQYLPCSEYREGVASLGCLPFPFLLE